ncbi:hypothetical protein SAMN04488700_0375 [Carnobacterium iners]|uniref:Uncharacterized protein n=1 Tax=Carnobacterium iners TaxID=1073423 RepID=A0A1X7MQ70_9LACT|nr:hypothetical protein [Carnobacterium iners]SEL34177.1 hypothetical protein SAMN04488114_15610 [Carnobacterium iners]SMH26989.1 hypothetical protein SAMN04488700_0375 [Carnobacterium iners]
MQFPSNIVVAVIISAVHNLISFNIKLSSKYKKKFRLYSVVVNLIFIAFLLGFSMFFKTSLPNQGINIYYNGLSILYFLLFIPLGVVLILLFKKLIMNADIYLVFLKYVIIIGAIITLTGIIALGYVLSILTFYGFAP